MSCLEKHTASILGESSARSNGTPGASLPNPCASLLMPQASRLAWRIRVLFAGQLFPREYVTQDIRFNDPGWASEVFNRQIEQLEFFLPTGHKILMAGMEAYNFFVEATQALSTRGGVLIEAFWFCGKYPSLTDQATVEMWRVGNGKVVRQQRPWGKEWGGTATRGWKFGLVGTTPTSILIKE